MVLVPLMPLRPWARRNFHVEPQVALAAFAKLSIFGDGAGIRLNALPKGNMVGRGRRLNA
jgi:hypothetical protein